MNRWKNYLLAGIATTFIATISFAQDLTDAPKANDGKEKSQEIVIKKSGKTEKMTIVVDNDQVTINGTPLKDFKSGNVTIYQRDAKSGPGSARVRAFLRGDGEDLNIDLPEFDHLIPTAVNKAMLGVVTEKAIEGVKVTGVTKESGAEKAGLKKDDVITKVGSTKVSDPKELTEAIAKFNPNDKVDIAYKRDGKEAKTTATLGENKGRVAMHFDRDMFNFEMPNPPHPPMENFNFNFNRKPRIGMQIKDLEEGKGVSVEDVDEESPAAKAGLKENDVITQIDGKEIVGVDQLKQQIKDAKEGDAFKLTYKRDGKVQTTEVKIPKRLKTADL